MRRLLLLLVVSFGLVLSAGTLALAQDASPPAQMGEEANVCPEAEGTPVASPETTATDEAMRTPTAATEGSPIASPSAEAECRVDIEDNAFRPATIEIAVDTTVTWVNHDAADRRGAHTVTADDGSFDSGDLDQGQTFSHTFEEAGVFSYHCENHPDMMGTVIVR
jgi:plastocyanin